MDELVAGHAAILDRYDPERRIGLSVSEWGSWWATDEARPSNLYQTTTLRDAVIAGLTLNIFQNRAERVRMANIAQMVNVLQAMILTRGERMIVTPTYHVFDLYQTHQGATSVPTRVSAPDYSLGTVKVPSISASASVKDRGTLTLSVVNLDPNRDMRIRTDLHGFQARRGAARVITAARMDAHPDFGAPDPLAPVGLRDLAVGGGAVTFTAPAKSVLVV
jgi:alpha-N-arabinofuranosidase